MRRKRSKLRGIAYIGVVALLFSAGRGSLAPSPALGHVPPPPVRDIRIRALLDGSQVVRPEEHRPPELGSGSTATAEMDMLLLPGPDKLGTDNRFSLDLLVRGIDIADLDVTQTDNDTAVHIHLGGPLETGPMLLDVHYYALEEPAEANGVTPTGEGFRLHAEGKIAEEQGELAEGFSVLEIMDFLRSEEAYIVVRTTTDPLFGGGEIRGQLRVVPEKLRLRAALDESQVVRPPELRPPELGTGSSATGEFALAVNTVTARFSLGLSVRGIDPSDLDNSHGENRTAIHVRSGAPGTSGDIILDVQHYARGDVPQADGITPTPGGFDLHAEGIIAPRQGDLDTALTVSRIIDLLRKGEAYVDVHTGTDPLFRAGEIRGNLEVVPNEYHVRATLDESQIVRPFQFRPPDFGTGSAAGGEAHLFVNRDTGRFRFQLSVDGIDPVSLSPDECDPNRGNETAVHVYWGLPDLQGPVLIDVHHYARLGPPGSDGVEAIPGGFRMEAEGAIARLQGLRYISFTLEEIIDFLTSQQAYISVSTNTEPLFECGEIRGNFEMVREIPGEKLELTARLDESQVVRPEALRPPALGTGSTSTGEAVLSVDVETRGFTFDLEVTGIDPADFDNSQGEHGANHTAIHIYKGGPDVRGAIILDVHHFARSLLGATDGVTATGNGFRMHAAGTIRRAQGAHDIGIPGIDVIEALRCEEAYVEVHTSTSPLFSAGEIRGNLKLAPRPEQTRFRRGDANTDGRVNVTDAVSILEYLFAGGTTPACLKSADLDDNGTVTLTDPLALLNFLFLSAAEPPAPFAACGSDPTPDTLECASFPPCG